VEADVEAPLKQLSPRFEQMYCAVGRAVGVALAAQFAIVKLSFQFEPKTV